MKKARKSAALVERNRKIAESHRLRAMITKQFAVGDMVQQKYYPKSVGLVMSAPKIIRENTLYNLVPQAYVDVLWIAHPYLTVGEVAGMYVQHLSQKKVLET